MKKRMKKGYIFLPVLLLVLCDFSACVSLQDRPLSSSDQVVGSVTTEFVSYQLFHYFFLPSKRKLLDKARDELLEIAKEQYKQQIKDNSIEIRNIRINGGFPHFPLAYIGIPGGLFAGWIISQNNKEPYEINDMLISGGIGAAIGLALGNIHRVTAVGDVVLRPPPPKGEAPPIPLKVYMLERLRETEDWQIGKLQLYISGRITLERDDAVRDDKLDKGRIVFEEKRITHVVSINERTEGQAITMEKNDNGYEIEVKFENDEKCRLLFRSNTTEPDEQFYLRYSSSEDTGLSTGGKGSFPYDGVNEYKLNFSGAEPPHLLIKLSETEEDTINRRTASGIRVY